jgi:acetylornithine deacetylase
MEVTECLERLIAFQSVVGTSNHAIVDWIRAYLEELGSQVHILPGPERDRANLFATFGPADRPGYILSGHLDVVPAMDGWRTNPFKLRVDGPRLYGRGTSDMKGFLAAVLAAAPRLASTNLVRPIHLAFSYDEEAGCIGVPHLIARLPELCAAPAGAIIGEPSGLRGILAHKGKAAARLTVLGRAGHSSRPDLGRNAIHAMAAVLSAAARQADALAQGRQDQSFEPAHSSLQIGIIRGGHAVNVIPETCQIELEARAIPGVDPESLLYPIRVAAEVLADDGFELDWQTISAYPGLSLRSDAPLAALMTRLTGNEPLEAVSYGSEAGLYQAAGIDAVICGPGDIGRAHKADEYILIDELQACQSMIEKLGALCALQIEPILQ